LSEVEGVGVARRGGGVGHTPTSLCHIIYDIMPGLFQSLRRPLSTSTADEKDRDDDDVDVEASSSSSSSAADGGTSGSSSIPLLLDQSTSIENAPQIAAFALRIKLNDAGRTVDLSLSNVNPSITTVGRLKILILAERRRRRRDGDDDPRTTTTATGGDEDDGHYLRLIIRGRMMAPDIAALETFNVIDYDVIHAVLVRGNGNAGGGGMQARMLSRMNNIRNRGTPPSNRSPTSHTSPRPRGPGRRSGMDWSGGAISTTNANGNDDTDDDDMDDDIDGDIAADGGDMGGDVESGDGRRNRRLAGGGTRRGFDRLREVGFSLRPLFYFVRVLLLLLFGPPPPLMCNSSREGGGGGGGPKIAYPASHLSDFFALYIPRSFPHLFFFYVRSLTHPIILPPPFLPTSHFFE
jgi:hypothetical protein